METPAFLYYALLARRLRWERIEDARIASSFPHMGEEGRKEVIEELNHHLQGPGVYVDWTETISDEAKAKMAEADRERDEAWESLVAAGFLEG